MGVKGRKKRRGRREEEAPRRRSCSVCLFKLDVLDPGANLDRFVTPRGKIRSARATGTCARHQRQVARAIKRQRELALRPYRREMNIPEKGRR